MDATALARRLLEPVPAHRTLGLRVVHAEDGAAEIAVDVLPELFNVIGSMHSSGLIALVDAAGLAALISSVTDEQEFDGIVPLGATSNLEFRKPALGPLFAKCALEPGGADAMRELFTRRRDKVGLTTRADIFDAANVVVCTGTFDWSVRRTE
jgi:acyl-coenzyme A thioesterase PaaI-like protein